jgi:carbohydrate diacid regulator
LMLIDATDYLTGNGTGRFQATEVCIQNRTQAVIDAVLNYFHLPGEAICAYIGEGEIAVLKAGDGRSLDRWADGDEGITKPAGSWADIEALKRAARGLLEHLPGAGESWLRIGIGRYHRGLLGLARSYEDARVALSLGQRLRRPGCVFCLDEFGIATFVGVADEQLKMEMAAHILSPLEEEPELMDTLVTFFACDCQQLVTAGQLCIHRNTLGYRLDKIASLTGLDPRRFEEAIQIRLALFLGGLYAGVV